MHITLISFDRGPDEDPRFDVEVSGEMLIINDEEFDFSLLGEGDTLPAKAANTRYFSGDITRIGGAINLSLYLPCGRNASEERKRLTILHNPEDGPIQFEYDGETDGY